MKKLLPLVIALALFVSILPIQANAAEVIASGKCGPDATWTYDSDKTLTITGTGPITMATWYMHNSDGIIKAVIGEGITTICDSAFTDREEMQEVVLPSTLKHIGYAAFYRCYGLKNLTVPASLETIDIVAFAACNIENVYVSSLEHWLSLDRSMSQMYYDNLYVNGQLVTELVYPASCPHVWYECFKGVDSLKKVTLPATVQSIGEYAFYDCNGLQEVVLPENVKHLRPYTFGACDSLTTLTIPAGVSVVADYVFTEEDSTGWSAIKSLRFAGSAPLFGANAFSQVNATVYYPANDPSWTPQVRQNYGGQINWVADASLHGGSGSQEVLASGTCGPNATWSISSTGVLTISGTGKATDNPWCEDYQSVIRQLKVNEGITDLGESLFYGATSLYYAELPNSLLTIGDVCFKDCTSLKEIILPNNIHTIESQAFMASALEKVHLPNKLQELSDNLFLDCLSLKEITIPASVKKVGHMVFSVGWADADIIRSMDQIRFLGDAPEFSDSAFANLRATVLVPEGNPTWTSDVKNNYGGWITWGYGQGHYYESEVTPATCAAGGYTTYTCGSCGDSYVTDYTSPLPHTWSSGSCTKPRTCTVCGESSGSTGHIYDSGVDGTCNFCGVHRETTENRIVMHMFRMYDPNSGEHFYTGSEVERDNLVAEGWNYEGVGFTFSMTTGMPVYRLYDPINGEHLYTMNAEEKAMLMAQGWNFEGIAFNSAYDTEVPQYRLHNPNETRGAYHFTASIEERDYLLSLGWEDQGIGFYSSWK